MKHHFGLEVIEHGAAGLRGTSRYARLREACYSTA